MSSYCVYLQNDRFPLLIMVCRLKGFYEVMTLLTGHGFANTPSTRSWSTLSDTNFHQNTDDDVTMTPSLGFPSLEDAISQRPQNRHPPAHHASKNSSLQADEVVGELWQKITMYQERLQDDILADQERAERELMREEQDMAYKESLAQDRQKVRFSGSCIVLIEPPTYHLLCLLTLMSYPVSDSMM